jgi:hypothetical protein
MRLLKTTVPNETSNRCITSRTNWEKFESLTEEEIDTSDIPPITEEFLGESRWWKTLAPLNVLV